MTVGKAVPQLLFEGLGIITILPHSKFGKSRGFRLATIDSCGVRRQPW